MICSILHIVNTERVIKLKKIKVGTGFRYFKNKAGITHRELSGLLGYKNTSSVQQIAYIEGCNTVLVDKLAHAFGVTPAEFIEQCTVEEVKK